MALPRVSLFQSAMRMRLTYGTLPTYEQFADAFAGDLGEDGVYRITNCNRVGNESFTCSELWDEVNDATTEHNDQSNDAAGDWASCVLQTLGIEWV